MSIVVSRSVFPPKYTIQHFDKWYKAYKPYIDNLWITFHQQIQNDLGLASKCSYFRFVDFIYDFSSGHIENNL